MGKLPGKWTQKQTARSPMQNKLQNKVGRKENTATTNIKEKVGWKMNSLKYEKNRHKFINKNKANVYWEKNYEQLAEILKGNDERGWKNRQIITPTG